MISKFFIERPVLANVLAILMIVIGGVALFALPVAQYPEVVPPTVQVTTRYPGASAGMAANAPIRVTGTVVAGTSVARQSCRKIRMTTRTRIAASYSVL